MTEKRQEENGVWVEYLYDGTWLMRIYEDKLLGYHIRGDPCNYTENEAPYEEGLIPDFKTYAHNSGLEPIILECVWELFDWSDKSFAKEGTKA